MRTTLGVILYLALVLLSLAALAAPFVAFFVLPMERWGLVALCVVPCASLGYGLNEMAYRVGRQLFGSAE